ncbi:MAG: hypothetical protein ABJP82_00785, partial [Hyphomicrobiales bacterium]
MRRATEKLKSGLDEICARLLQGCALGLLCVSISAASAQDAGQRQNMIVGIGVCPPWNAQSGEVCKHSVETVVTSFSDRLDLDPSKTHMMFNEGASADGLKRTITELSNKLGYEDRLIIYANLPSKGIDLLGDSNQSRQVLELWADHEPENAEMAIKNGIWIS